MPDRTEDELLALVRQKAEAMSNRRRRQIGLATGVLLLLGLTTTVVARSGVEPGTDLQTVAGEVSTSTSTSPSSTTATSIVIPPAPAPTSTTGIRPTSTTAPPRATTPTTARTAAPATTTTLACRNSGEPACGPFRWEPPLPPDKPLTVAVSVSPPTPRAGDAVTFRVTVDDPDGNQLVSRDLGVADYGDGTPVTRVTAILDCVERYGPHTPPAPAPVHEEVAFQHVYAAPGTYTATFTYRSLGDCAYGPSEGARSVVVTVTPR